MNTWTKIVVASLALAAAAPGARAGEDTWRPRRGWCGTEECAQRPQAAPAAPAPKTVASDERITDATTAFDTALYPKGPVAELVFWGFEGAKTDYSKTEDLYCDRDVAVLRANLRKAAAGLPEEEAAKLSASKKVLTRTYQYCPERGEDRHGSRVEAPSECRTTQDDHCAAALASASPRLALRYKELPPMASNAECLAAIAAESARAAVIDSHVKPGPRAEGCVAQLLEIVAR